MLSMLLTICSLLDITMFITVIIIIIIIIHHHHHRHHHHHHEKLSPMFPLS